MKTYKKSEKMSLLNGFKNVLTSAVSLNLKKYNLMLSLLNLSVRAVNLLLIFIILSPLPRSTNSLDMNLLYKKKF